MLRVFRQVTCCLALGLVGAGASSAQSFGRLQLQINDEQGKPLEGVKVTVTTKQLESYLDEGVTNKKGSVTIAFGDTTKVYDLALELDGYRRLDTTFKPEFRSTRRVELVLQPASAVRESAGVVEGEVQFTAAEKVFNSGVELLRAGELEGAEAKFLEALDRDSDLAGAHSALGGVYLELQKHEMAIAAARRLLELEPESSRGFRILYEAHRGLGNQAEADRALAKLTELDRSGEVGAMVYNEGVAALRLGDRAMAKKRFRDALAVKPELGAALSALAILYMQEESWSEAAGLGERLLELDPGSVKAKQLVYDAYSALDDTEKAAAAFEVLAAADPHALAAKLYEQAIASFNQGDLAAAIDGFGGALAVDPSLISAHYHLGLCHASRGDNAKARQHLERYIELEPKTASADVATAAEMLQYLAE